MVEGKPKPRPSRAGPQPPAGRTHRPPRKGNHAERAGVQGKFSMPVSPFVSNVIDYLQRIITRYQSVSFRSRDVYDGGDYDGDDYESDMCKLNM